MPKHVTTLEFEVYGKNDINTLRNALEKAGIALEFVEATAAQTQRKIHSLNSSAKMATATLDNLNNSQKKTLKNILNTISAANRGSNAPFKPLIKETVTLETRQQEEARRQAEKTERERERQHRREIARIERERRESRRRLGRMVGLDNRDELVGKSVSGPMRVIAYDLVRRTLTEIYGLVNKIGNSISNWIIDGIKFNDELARSQAFFTSLGILGFKGITGQQMTIAEAGVSKDPKVSEMYNKSVANSEKVMRRLMAVSALTGQDLGEIVSSARQGMTDLLNKLNKEGKPGTYLKNVDALNDVSERMVKLASVLRMADPQNRKLSFHMVGLQELFSGTTGEGKDKKKESAGLQNVRSILMREGIRIGEERARKITQYVNTGNLQAAMDVVQDALERSGLGFEQLSNMMNSTLQPAIDGTLMYLRIFNKVFTTDLYNQVVKPFFQATLRHFSIMEQNKTFVSGIEKLGRQFADAADSIIGDFARIIDYVTLVPDFSTKEGKAQYDKMGKEVLGFFTTMTGMENVIDTIKGGAQVMYAVFKVIGQFIWGLMSARDGKGLQDFAKQVESLGQTAQKWGRELREAFEWMLKAIKDNKVELMGFTFKLTDLVKGALILAASIKIIKLAIGGARGITAGVGVIQDFSKQFGEWRAGRAAAKAAKTAGTTGAAAAAATKPGIMSSIWSGIQTAFKYLFDLLPLIGLFFKELWTKFTTFAKNLKLSSTFSYLFNISKQFIGEMLASAIASIKAIPWVSLLKRYLPTLLRFIPYVGWALAIGAILYEIGPYLWDALKQYMPPAIMKFIDDFKDVFSFLSSKLYDWWYGIESEQPAFGSSPRPIPTSTPMPVPTPTPMPTPTPIPTVMPTPVPTGIKPVVPRVSPNKETPKTTIGQVIINVTDPKQVGQALDSIAPKTPKPTPTPIPPDFKPSRGQ